MGIAADAVVAWLAASGLRSGAIFRRIRKGTTLGVPLTASAVRRIVLQRCQMAGLEGKFSAHSSAKIRAFFNNINLSDKPGREGTIGSLIFVG